MNPYVRHFKDASTVVLFFTAIYLACLFPSSAKRLPEQEASTPEPRNEMVDRYDPGRDPEKDLAMVSAEAQRSKRHIFVVVGGEWCVWCLVMDTFFREHPDLAALRDKNYVSMKMSDENRNGRFLARFPYIPAYPHIFILDADKNLIKSQRTDQLRDGNSYSEERFRELFNQFAARRSVR
jgi:hypothetical protein